jgi:hypothetical protein
MTKENCIKLLKFYKETNNVRAYEDMKKHILTTKKFQGDPIINELTEEKEDGKKSKR